MAELPPVIDSHQHFWQHSLPFDYSWQDGEAMAPIRRDYLPADLEPLIRDVGVDRTVFVQTQHNRDENRWVLQLADKNPFIAGIVGWIDLAADDCEDQLIEFRSDPRCVGIRHVTHDEPDDDFIVRPEVLRGLGILEAHRVPFDLLFFVKHLRHATAIAERFPELPLVIDHLAKPHIKAGRLDDWETDFRNAARHPNVYCKLSGMVTEADWQNWKPEQLKPYVDIALDAFGPERCMYGSDWPVCELAASYQQVYRALNELISRLSDAERARILGGTAAEFYQLPLK